MKPDPYASEEETKSLLRPDARTAAERKLDASISEAWGDEQGAESEVVLRAMLLGTLIDIERKDALLRQALEYLAELRDMGPIDEGLQSDELMALQAEIKQELAK